MSADPPADAITAADAWARSHGHKSITYCNAQPRESFEAGWDAALAAALPALTAATAAPFDPMTEPEGFRAYQAGIKAGRADAAQAAADEREACAQLAEQHHAQYASCPVKCDNPACGKRAGFAHLIRARGLLAGTADGAHTPGDAA